MVSLRKLSVIAMTAGLALLYGTGPVRAQPYLWLGSTDGGNSGVIVGSGNPGMAKFSGALPGDPLFSINETTGISQHLALGQGALDLNSVNMTLGAHAGTDTLYILLSDVGFGPASSGSLHMSLGGTLDAGTSLTAWSKTDPTNTLWGGVNPSVPPGTLSGTFTGQLGPFTDSGSSSKGFSGDTDVFHPAVGNYSLTEEVAITFGPSSGTQTVSFDFHAQNVAVPEPSSLIMAIVGIAGAGVVYGLRRR
jgi:hypothetical protein